MTNKTAQEPSSGTESLLSELPPIRELLVEVRTYPERLLRRICDQYAERDAPVPDHALRLAPYLGETALRALIEGGFVERQAEDHISVHAYVPTESGRALLDGHARPSRAAPKTRAASKPKTAAAPKKIKA